MNFESLKDYGRPFSETMTALPDSVRRLARSQGAKVIRKEMGLLMNAFLQPWQLRAVMLAGWVNRQQHEIIESQRAERASSVLTGAGWVFCQYACFVPGRSVYCLRV
jgi:hypothetical protein